MIRTAYNSSRFPSPVLLSVMFAAVLAASPGLHAGEAGNSTSRRSLTVDCGRRHISQHQASWLLGTNNVSAAYARRAALHADIARACAAGVAAVRVDGKRLRAPSAQLSRR